MNNKGMTLIESTLAFSIFVVCVISFVSLYNDVFKHYQNSNQEFNEYVLQQNSKEKQDWIQDSFQGTIDLVLP